MSGALLGVAEEESQQAPLKVTMTIRVRAADAVEDRVREAIAFREYLLERMSNSPLAGRVNFGRLYWSLNARVQAWDGLTYVQGIMSFYRKSGIVREVQDNHVLRGLLKNEDGTPKMVKETVWEEAPHAQLIYDMKHDGERWRVEFKLHDLQSGPRAGREPMMQTVEAASELVEVKPAIEPFVSVLSERAGV